MAPPWIRGKAGKLFQMIKVNCCYSLLSTPGGGAFSRDFTTNLTLQCRALKIEKLKKSLFRGYTWLVHYVNVFRINSVITKKSWYMSNTRGISKVHSMFFYLSNRFTNPIVFGIILMCYLSSMLWHKFHEVVIMHYTKKMLLWIHALFVYWKTQNFSGKYKILTFEKCAEH